MFTFHGTMIYKNGQFSSGNTSSTIINVLNDSAFKTNNMSIPWKCYHLEQFSKSGLEKFWSYNFVKTSLMISKSIWEPFFSKFHFP